MRSDAQPPRSGGGSRTRNFRSISTLSIYPDPASSQQAFDASGRATERDVAASARSLGLAPWFSARDRSRKQSPARRYELPLRARRVSRCRPHATACPATRAATSLLCRLSGRSRAGPAFRSCGARRYGRPRPPIRPIQHRKRTHSYRSSLRATSAHAGATLAQRMSWWLPSSVPRAIAPSQKWSTNFIARSGRFRID